LISYIRRGEGREAQILTLLESLNKLGCSGTLANGLDELSVVDLRGEENPMHDVTVVIADGNEGNLLVPSPARALQGEIALLVRREREASEKGCELFREMIL
jgi:hypothetical protein